MPRLRFSTFRALPSVRCPRRLTANHETEERGGDEKRGIPGGLGPRDEALAAAVRESLDMHPDQQVVRVQALDELVERAGEGDVQPFAWIDAARLRRDVRVEPEVRRKGDHVAGGQIGGRRAPGE